ncbi:MAG TPA: hypothetical protein VE195_00175 [Acidobacteriaceae bacterium]|nr:hypothetical protein [Acidobacteriaceae bacterium]
MRDLSAPLRSTVLLLLIGAVPGLFAQTAPVQIPAGTPLPVQLGKHLPMKTAEPLDCHLMYPVYAKNKVAIPAGSVVRGHVVALTSDRSRRIHGRLWGDFTPFYIPVVHFDRLVLPDGTVEKISSSDATDGAPVLHLSTPAAGKSHSFISRQFSQLKQQAKDTAALVIAPGRKDRLVQLLYRQLPYHPQRIESGTMWTVTLEQPLTLTKNEAPEQAQNRTAEATAVPPQAAPKAPSASKKPAEDKAWHLSAYLQKTISSATEKKGDTFDAVVAAPIFSSGHTVEVPEGSVMVGTITQSKPARFFGRAGKLRFDFRELKLPGAASQPVQGTLAGTNSSKSEKLKIDSEGGIQPQPQNRVIVPLVLTFLAGRALDNDGNLTANTAVASNGFGIVGRIVGIVSGSRYLAAGIGYYAAALSVYERWLVRGQNVAFVKNTRIEVTMIPSRNPIAATTAQPNTSERH